MTTIRAAITAVHGYVPETILSNSDLEKMVETNDEWIQSRTGIKERRILKEPGLATSDMAVEAIRPLLDKRGIGAEEIDLIICATVTPDMPFPATANIISDKIGATNAFSFDIGAACSGFIYALATGSQFIQSGSCKKVIVVGADKMSAIVDYTDRATCIIFGDGAGAVLLEADDTGTGILDSYMKSDGSGRHNLHQKAGGSLKPASKETVEAREHFVFQEGKHVFKRAVTHMAEAAQILMNRNNLQVDDLSWFVPHQANKRIIDVVSRSLKVPIEKVIINIDRYGNTTAATIPLCLWEWENKFEKNQNIILAAFGGGFTWGAIYLKWAY